MTEVKLPKVEPIISKQDLIDELEIKLGKVNYLVDEILKYRDDEAVVYYNSNRIKKLTNGYTPF